MPTDGQALTFNGSTGDLEWRTPAAGGGTLIGAYSSRPAAGSAGRIFVCNDPGIVAFIDDGTAWRPLCGPNGGTIGTESAPGNDVTGYTTINAAVKSASVGVARVSHINAGALQICGMEKARTSGQKVKACLQFGMNPAITNSEILAGVYVRDSSTDAAVTLLADYFTQSPSQVGLIATEWTNSTTYGSELQHSLSWETMPQVPTWFQITDDGTQFHFQYSWDGVNFSELTLGGTVAGYDRAGFCVVPHSNNAVCDAISFDIL